MGEPVRTIALVTHQVPSVSADALADVLPLLREREIELMLPAGEAEKHPELAASGVRSCCDQSWDELAEADLCLVLGGDGTMLRALRFTRDLEVPVAGINLGRVGFFAAVRRLELATDLPRILDGEYVRHPLIGLSCRLDGTLVRAVNDVVVGRGREAGIRHISYSVNGVTLFDVRCDALVVATPAGSTAYNLAVGGPVLGIGLEGYVLSYVAPHHLGTRSVVAASSDVVRVRNESQHDPVGVVADGDHVGSLDPLASLELHTVPAMATLALLPECDFYCQFKDRFV